MEIREMIQQTELRRKGFLKALPEEQRRLLKLYLRAKRNAKFSLYGILVWLVVLLAVYLIVSIAFSYPRNWMWNGILACILFILGTILLLLLHRSYRKKAEALASSIPDYAEQFDQINRRLSELKKAERNRAMAERKAMRAEERARVSAERATEKIRETEDRAIRIREKTDADATAAKEAIRLAEQQAKSLVPDETTPFAADQTISSGQKES